MRPHVLPAEGLGLRVSRPWVVTFIRGGWGRVAGKAASLRSLRLSSCPARPGPEPRVAPRSPLPSSAGLVAPVFWVASRSFGLRLCLSVSCLGPRGFRRCCLGSLLRCGCSHGPRVACAFPPSSHRLLSGSWAGVSPPRTVLSWGLQFSSPFTCLSLQPHLFLLRNRNLSWAVRSRGICSLRPRGCLCSDVLGLGGSRW